MIKEKKYILAVIGLGNMGGALLSGIINSNFLKKEKIAVYDIDSLKVKKFADFFNVTTLPCLKEVVLNAKYILLAVKPQNIPEILADIKEVLGENDNVILSIAAGLSTQFFEKNIGNIGVIRIMPNSPALYGKGISAISCGRFVCEDDKKFAAKLMKNVGEVIFIDEKYQHIATVLSGSGPAYFFLFCKLMTDFGITHGLDDETAKKMVTGTMIGAGEIMINSKEQINDLIKSVASPGGTTQQALDKFKADNLQKIFSDALEAALNRSMELESAVSGK